MQVFVKMVKELQVVAVILHSHHEYYKHGFNFLGEDKSSGERLHLLKGMLHGTGAGGLLPSRKATWSVLLSAAPSLVFPPALPAGSLGWL